MSEIRRANLMAKCESISSLHHKSLSLVFHVHEETYAKGIGSAYKCTRMWGSPSYLQETIPPQRC